MKKLITTILLTLCLLPTTYAAEAPPNLDLGELFENNEPPEQQAPPSLDADFGQNQPIALSSVRVSPNPFNPLTQDTQITFRLSAAAAVSVEILNSLGQTILNLADNDVIGAGEYTAEWKGTVNNQANTSPVEQGTYAYRITAKNPDNGQIVDTKQGNIQLIYGSATPPANTPREPVPAPQPNRPINNQDQTNAILTVQNMNTGRTSETGMPVFAYLAIPFAYLVPKFLIKKQ